MTKKKSAKPQAFIGTSGWNYDHWKGIFYPENLSKTRWLKHYAGEFSTIEVNATFYRQMKESTFLKWHQDTPEGFVWSVKASRFITHVRRLQDVEEAMERFFTSVSPLKEKLGPVLFQLPPSLSFDRSLLEDFCSLIPDKKRCTIEARHASWTKKEALSSLEAHGIAWCISDTAGRYPYLEAVTSDFSYIRFHGSTALYASNYSEQELRDWAAKIRSFGVDTYAYFDNDFEAYAPQNALRLRELLGE
jgi:uncharacterized protein YecE (DUF72 family)